MESRPLNAIYFDLSFEIAIRPYMHVRGYKEEIIDDTLGSILQKIWNNEVFSDRNPKWNLTCFPFDLLQKEQSC